MFFKEFELPKEPFFQDLEVSITDFGAKNGEKVTSAINDAINYVSEHGGGRVVIPKGNFLSGAIHLKSGVNLHFEDGAHVSFSTDRQDYLPVVLINYEGIRCYNYSPFIYANNVENVAITGKGYLEGNGSTWWNWSKTSLSGRNRLYKMMVSTPVEERVFGRDEDYLRSPFVQILNGKNILIEDIELHNSPFWTIHIVWSEKVIVRGVKIENQTLSTNTDGINIDACNTALVENCTLKTMGDDMFCLKSGRNEDAWAVGKACENVVIRHCHGVGESKSGGIVIGSEMSGSVRNILAHDCDFENNINCIRIKAKDGRGGVVENIEYKNLRLKQGMRGISLTFRYSCEATDDPAEPGKYMPEFRNIYFENIVCENTDIGVAFDNVIGGKMSNILMKDVTIHAKQCLAADSLSGLNMENVNFVQIEK